MTQALTLRVGDLVEVLGEEEILATLDERGELDGLPFMPEMLPFCGKRMVVKKVAHKLCDTMTQSGMRRMDDAVYLEGARCDGSGHGGCQTFCSIYWKTAWLKKVADASAVEPAASPGVLLPLLVKNSFKEPAPEGEVRYSCQATELLRAAPVCLPFRDAGQYVTDVRTGNATVWETVRTVFFGLFDRYQNFSRRRLPRRLWIRGGLTWGWVGPGPNKRTPSGTLDLEPGELVRIKSKAEIIATLGPDRKNRGLGFEEEMAHWCGKTARVQARVERCLDEKTGQMLQMKNPCILLEDVVCKGLYKTNCPREFAPFWREIWLERLTEPDIA
ncbi:hypothetical protein AB0O28_39205 [Microbispora sp. NPDC088329]|uniref:hypothetical protein n=1 Tax=Microbispora sp. NPDC088329 TaxID=3154869 RepID=UPI0034402D0D